MKKGLPVFREYIRQIFKLGPAIRELGLELHLICPECGEEVGVCYEAKVKADITVEAFKDPSGVKDSKLICACTERELWGK